MDAANTYHRRAAAGATPVGLIVLLYQAAVVALRRGIAAMDAGDIEARTLALNRVLALVAELKASLNYETGGEVARQFARFYHLAERLILQASCQKDAEPLRELLEQFVRVRDAWQQVDKLPPEQQRDPVTSLANLPPLPETPDNLLEFRAPAVREGRPSGKA
ncbi:MAG: flagellar export chaperone FliS [Terriglobales bacterium]